MIITILIITTATSYLVCELLKINCGLSINLFNPLHNKPDIAMFFIRLLPLFCKIAHKIRGAKGTLFLSPCKIFDSKESRRNDWSLSLILANEQYRHNSSRSCAAPINKNKIGENKS
jgi:hypothetical protein